MLARINGEILGIVVKGGWFPGCFGVTAEAVGRKLRTGVGRIGGLIVILLVTAKAGVGGVGIIAVVAGCTISGNRKMCTLQDVIIVVNRKSGRLPVGLGVVTIRTGGRDIQTLVVGIY